MTDRASSYRWSRTIRTKDQAADALKQVIQLIETQFNRKAKTLTTDGSRELHPDLPGLVVRASAPYTPAQNGMAERANQLVIQGARTMILAAKMPTFLWPEVVAAAVHIGNRTWTRRQAATPIQRVLELLAETEMDVRLSGISSTTDHLRVIGCRAFVNIPEQRRVASRKLEARAEAGTLVGFEGTTNYRVYIPQQRTVVVTPHVTFHEDVFPGRGNRGPMDLEIEVFVPPVRRRRRRRVKHWVRMLIYMASADMQSFWTWSEIQAMSCDLRNSFIAAAQREV